MQTLPKVSSAPILRDYQQQAVNELRHNFSRNIWCQILLLATGGGKTVVFSSIVHQTVNKPDSFKKVLILTHRGELNEQANATLQDFGINPFVLKKEVKDKDIQFGARVMVSMAETYRRRLIKFPQLADFDLVIIDECHVGSFKKLFAAWAALNKRMRVIGCTATPISTVRKEPLNSYYECLVNPTSISELIDTGSLVPARTFSAVFNRKALGKDRLSEDGYSERSQMNQLDRRVAYDGLIDKFRKHCVKEDGTYRKSVCFNVNVEHSKNVAASFNEAGIPALHIDGYMSKDERDDILKLFTKTDLYTVLCNSSLLVAGWDYKPLECVIFNVATKSTIKWLQGCGRGSRPYPGKEDFVILDMAENWTELGLWQAERDWQAIFDMLPDDREPDAPPAKLCPKCEAINATSARICRECGYTFPPKPKELPEDVEFTEVTQALAEGMAPARREEILQLMANPKSVPYATLDIPTLLDIQKVKGYPFGWLMITLAKRAKSVADFRLDVQEVADWQNKFQPWVEARITWYVETYLPSVTVLQQ